MPRLELHHQYGLLIHLDNGAAANSRMLVVHALQGHRKHGSSWGLDSVPLTAAEPESPFPVQVAKVTPAVPKDIPVWNFGGTVRVWTLKVALGDLRALNADLTDLAGGQRAIRVPLRDGVV